MASKINRRSLFKRLLSRNVNAEDPLFEKYRRKNYSIRHNASSTNARIGPVSSGLAPYTGPWTLNEATYLLRRTQFGFKKPDADAFVNLGMTASVNALLNFTNTTPNPPINYYQPDSADENGLPYGSDWTQNVFTTGAVGGTTNTNRTRGLAAWCFALGVNQDLNIREKMALFWYHFIPIDFTVVRVSQNSYCGTNSARICYDYMKYYRENCMGNFKTIIRNMATQPAMMYYLNNQANTKNAPDENFAREVMELFTLGKDPLSAYTQEDVVEAAKVLTGWRVKNLNAYPTTTTYDDALHDKTTKTFSAFFNNTVISGTGANELDAFIDMIFSKSIVVSEYICRRLYRFFVYYDIDANIEANVITPLAQVFVSNNWNIQPVLDTLFKSQHFYDMANRGAYIKSPFDLVIGSLRTFNIGATVSDATNYNAQYKLWNDFNSSILFPIEQAMGTIPNVSGWNAFYQKPSYHEYWINSTTTQKRFNFFTIIFGGYNKTYNGLQTRIEVDVITWIQQFPATTCADPDLLVDQCVKYLLPVDLSVTVKNTLKVQNLLSNQTENYYWTTAWNNYIGNPTNTTNINTVKTRLKSLLLTITQLAEYQLM
ncbi:DUF1800 family protein [Flavobacterium sp.]|jgi:uncharacterized protein (DUF1800 family)|uniref:DUF1800 family protein n=1 Tax=Flavobacterium sp. TaxID=239 RepID=UPI0037BE9B50